MLPTLALLDIDLSPSAVTAVSRVEPPGVSPRRACATPRVRAVFVADEAGAERAAAWCDRCEAASECLVQALRDHAAHLHREEPYGVMGVFGGIWFEPDHPPRRVAHHGWENA